MTAASIAKAIGGKPMLDGFMCRCPVPGHGRGRGDLNQSLLIKDGNHALLVKCFANCSSQSILDELRRRGLIDGEAPRREVPAPKPTPIEHKPDPDAIAIWGAAAKATGTIAAKYLQARGITIPVPPSLRLGDGRYLDKYELPSLVAAVQAPGRTVIAVQCTLLDPRGDRKAQVRMPRKTTGVLGLGAVRLGPAGDALGISEGVETGLSAMELSGVPVWCCLGASRMCRVAIPDSVRELHIFGDNDDPGRAAAERTAHAHRDRRVVLRFPPEQFKDWNDTLAVQAGRAAA